VTYREMARLALQSVSGGHKKGVECQPERRECIEKWPGLLLSSYLGDNNCSAKTVQDSANQRKIIHKTTIGYTCNPAWLKLCETYFASDGSCQGHAVPPDKPRACSDAAGYRQYHGDHKRRSVPFLYPMPTPWCQLQRGDLIHLPATYLALINTCSSGPSNRYL
jgi:hypothetical protein